MPILPRAVSLTAVKDMAVAEGFGAITNVCWELWEVGKFDASSIENPGQLWNPEVFQVTLHARRQDGVHIVVFGQGGIGQPTPSGHAC